MASPWYSLVRDGTCSGCGLSASAVGRDRLGHALVAEAAKWQGLPDWPSAPQSLRTRPSPSVWSALEYACHTRDTVALFLARTELALVSDHPRFPYQDQDRAVVEQRYNEQDPRAVVEDLHDVVQRYAGLLASLDDAAWQRTGTRLEDEVFDVPLLARFALHETCHHLADAARSACVTVETK